MKTSKLIKMARCPLCETEGYDRHGDNLGVFDDGHTFCFARHGIVKKSLDKRERIEYPLDISKRYIDDIIDDTSIGYLNNSFSNNYNNNLKGTSLNNYTEEFIGTRGISEASMRAYGCKTRVNENGVPFSISFSFGSLNQVRSLQDKSFYYEGDTNDCRLFGMEAFAPGTGKAITITEGAFDALSVYEMFGRRYPCVSVRSVTTAASDCARAREYLNSFERIYLCFDSDKPGQDALKEVARLFDVNKVYHVKMGKFKDANEYLTNKATEEFVKTWWAARPYLPKGIVADYDTIGEILSAQDGGSIASYPFPTLDSMAYGIRSGEIVLLTAQEKVGKTEIIRAIEYHLLKTTDHNIGVIHLEEKEKRSIQGLVSYQVGKPCHLPDVGLSKDDQLRAYKDMTKRDGRLHFYTHFGSDDPDVILDVIRSLVSVCRCKFIFLDHITMLVTGYEGDDERRKLDYISTRLAMLTRELDFTLFLVSHVNDEGKTRGSRNISKVADLLIHLDRDIEADDADQRNATKIVVRGNRFASTSGPAGTLRFDPKTYTISEPKELGEGLDKPF